MNTRLLLRRRRGLVQSVFLRAGADTLHGDKAIATWTQPRTYTLNYLSKSNATSQRASHAWSADVRPAVLSVRGAMAAEAGRFCLMSHSHIDSGLQITEGLHAEAGTGTPPRPSIVRPFSRTINGN